MKTAREGMMMRNYLITIIYLLAYTPAAHADDMEKTMLAAAEPGRSLWQQTSSAMLPYDYARTTHTNQRLVYQGLKTYSHRVLANAGDYGPAVGVLGAAIDLAANDRRYHLNDSKSMGVLLKDTASSDRSVLLEYRKSW
jgi:hypothetical protein